MKKVPLKTIVHYLDELLKLGDFSTDHSNNGLQFEGCQEVGKIVFGVDGTLDLFRIAGEKNADMVFVHHGISWGGNLKRIVGGDARRISMLAKKDLSLYAAHLPLDAHNGIGHNALLAGMADLQYSAPFGEYSSRYIGVRGELPEGKSLSGLAALFQAKLPSSGDISIFGEETRVVKRIGIISGGGAFPSAFAEMEAHNLECLITGEMEHSAVSYAREAGASVIQLGHYRSEIPGVLAVMEDLKRYFEIETEFVDLPTGY